jgi:hypothetical protein
MSEIRIYIIIIIILNFIVIQFISAVKINPSKKIKTTS